MSEIITVGLDLAKNVFQGDCCISTPLRASGVGEQLWRVV
jgi:hypothetical protein